MKKNYKQYSTIPAIVPNTKFFKSIDIDLLKHLFSLQTPSLIDASQKIFFNFILNWCKENNISVKHSYDTYGNLYITKGKASLYPCVVSHVDTVHDYNPHLQILNTNDLVFGLDISEGTQHGIGADPKNGVYFALQMLKHLDVVKVVLFKNEEVGCLGSKASDITFFKNCSFVIQLDRRSFTTDLIEYTNGINVISEEFKTAVKPIMSDYGYEFNHGTCTDVGELVWNEINICAFNFSNGSFNEHKNYEVCSIPHLLNAVNAGYEIIQKLGYTKQFIHKPDTYKATSSKFSLDGWDSELVLTTKVNNKEVKDFVDSWLISDPDSFAHTPYSEEHLAGLYEYYTGKICDELAVLKAISSYLSKKPHAQIQLLKKDTDNFIKRLEKHEYEQWY